MVQPLRHRQTKEAATDMFDLQPPRHISTLHYPDPIARAQQVRSAGVLPTSFLLRYRRSMVDLSAPSLASAEAMACRSNDTSSLVANLVSWLSLSVARSKKRPFVHSVALGRATDARR